MSYFTAVIAHAGASWRAKDIEVDEAETLDDLVDMVRSVSSDGPVLTVLEHEDEWFALIRVDGEDEPRLFVSNARAASLSPFSEILDTVVEEESGDEDDDEEDLGQVFDDDADDDAPAENELDGDLDEDTPPSPIWGGDAEIMEDLGVSSRRLRGLVEGNSDDPGAVLGEVGDLAGFAELLEALR